MNNMTQSLDDLMREIPFSEADLESNRSGHMSDIQAARLRHARFRAVFTGFAVILLVALVATTLLFLAMRNGSIILNLIAVGLIVINAVMMGMFARYWLRLSADLRDGEVEIIEGELERVIRPYGRVNNYIIRIDGVQFSVTRQLFMQFRHESPYRIYRAPYSNALLSAEPL